MKTILLTLALFHPGDTVVKYRQFIGVHADTTRFVIDSPVMRGKQVFYMAHRLDGGLVRWLPENNLRMRRL